MFRFYTHILLCVGVCGCAINTVYDPVTNAGKQTFILNETALNTVRKGMTQEEVHRIMGDEITIGYAYQDADSKPITLANPYKTKEMKTSYGDCVAEYYVTAVHQPDGIVSDDEMMPLLFCKGVLKAKGWGNFQVKAFYVSLKPFLDHQSLARPVDWNKLFGNAKPVEVEIGFGNGEYLARLSAENPGTNYVGFEEYCERISRTLRKLSRGLGRNVRVMRLDVRPAFTYLFAPQSIDLIHCLYPPPWPKKSDAKHRHLNTQFLQLANSRLKKGGAMKVVTDFKPYTAWLEEQVPGSGFAFKQSTIPATYDTKFERKWVGEGKKEFYEIILSKQEHVSIGVKKDSVLNHFDIDRFDPDDFKMDDFSADGIAVVYKDYLYDPKRTTALVYMLVHDEHLLQNVRVVIFKHKGGWRVSLAQGSMLMPTPGIAKAIECVRDAVVKSGQ